MRKLCMLLCVAVLAASCIDDAYDLSEIETGDIAIGGDGSVFECPLLTVTLAMKDFTDESDGENVEEIFNEADIWLPENLPGGEEAVDVGKLTTPGPDQTTYLQALLDALIAELDTGNEKLDQLIGLIYDKYYDDFADLIPGLSEIAPGDKPTLDLFIGLFKAAWADPTVKEQISGEIELFAHNYLVNIEVNVETINIDAIDIDPDILDMLVRNIDGTKNKLQLYGSLSSELPLSFTTSAGLLGGDVTLTLDAQPDRTTAIEPVDISGDNLRRVVEQGSPITFGVALDKYYPRKGFNDQQRVKINLKIRKTGGLTFDL